MIETRTYEVEANIRRHLLCFGQATEELIGRHQAIQTRNHLTILLEEEFIEKNDGEVVNGLAGLNAYVNENESNTSLVSNRVSGKYVVLDAWSDVNKDTQTIYYAKDTKQYWYCNNGWKSTQDAYTAGLPSSVAGIQAETDDQSSKINQLTSWQGETNVTMSRIEQKADANGASITNIVSSVDKYSVGEYSQAYGLTREQAISILKLGYTYIPTEHQDTQSHSESFVGETGVRWFTPGTHYVWDINDQGNIGWIESSAGSVWISAAIPENSNGALKYWYIDSNDAPGDYEAHALYVWDEEQWKKVSTLAGNASNRMTSIIKQTTDKIAIDVANAQDSIASHQQWITDNSANIQDVVSWKTDVANDVSQIATIKQTADDAGASVALVVSEKDGEKVVNAASIVTAINNDGSSVGIDADVINFTAEDYQVIADNIDLNGYVTIESLQGEGTTTINGSNITTGIIKSNNYIENTSGMKLDLNNGVWDSAKFKVDNAGNIKATGGNIGGWTIDGSALRTEFEGNALRLSSASEVMDYWIAAGTSSSNVFELRRDGSLYSTKGTIGGWSINGHKIYKPYVAGAAYGVGMSSYGADCAFWAGDGANNGTGDTAPFRVYHDGRLVATSATITGNITASGGKIGTWGIQPLTGALTTSADLSHGYSAQSDNCVYFEKNQLVYVYKQGAYEGTNTIGAGWESIAKAGQSYSDINLKENIHTLDNEVDKFFDSLKPVSFNFKKGTMCGNPDETHFGFIAQEVEQAAIENNCKSTAMVWENEYYNLDKREFIALNTWQIQKAKARITELENKVAELEALIKGE